MSEHSGAGPSPQQIAAGEVTRMPGLFLILVGILNLPWAGYLLLNAAADSLMSQREFDRRMGILSPMIRNWGIRRALDRYTNVELKTWQTAFINAWTLLAFVAALLTIHAGRRLRQLRSFGVVVLGSIAACLPCVTFSGSCCIGELVGLWALVTLLNDDVRAAFR